MKPKIHVLDITNYILWKDRLFGNRIGKCRLYNWLINYSKQLKKIFLKEKMNAKILDKRNPYNGTKGKSH